MARRAQREVSVDQLAQHVDAALSAGRPAVAGPIRIRATECRLALGGERAVIE